MQLLLDLLYQGNGVVGPGDIGKDVCAQKPEGGDRIHLFSIHSHRGVDLSAPPKVHYELFCFKEVQHQVIF